MKFIHTGTNEVQTMITDEQITDESVHIFMKTNNFDFVVKAINFQIVARKYQDIGVENRLAIVFSKQRKPIFGNAIILIGPGMKENQDESI